MKPVLIFEHIKSSNAGLFAEFLNENSTPYQTVHVNEGDALPGVNSLSRFSGLCFLGGTESVTAPTPAMQEEMDLIQAAGTVGMPVIGHCLGGQLISRALGGEIVKHSAEEFGWSQILPEDTALSAEWVPVPGNALYAMQWHSDTFTIPPGATRIFRGEYCRNQAFVIGNMLAMQFHIEINEKTIRQWAIDLVDKHPPASDCVQPGEQILAELEEKFTISRRLAWHLYGKWLDCLY